MGRLEEARRALDQHMLDPDHTPNAVTSTVHDRMPVILDSPSYDLGLDPEMHNIEAISKLLKPCDARLMRAYPISPRINHVANDDEECS